jgi:hypothetical protein
MKIADEITLQEQLIQNPDLDIKDSVGVEFKTPQTFGAFKITVNTRRKKVRQYLRLKNVDVNLITSQIGVTPYNLNKYLNGKVVKKHIATLINDYLTITYDAMNKAVLESIKAAKIKAALKEKKVAKVKTKQIFDGESKEQVRDYLVEKFSTSNYKSGKVFSLPSSSCEFEKQLNLTFDNSYHYVVCEKKKDEFLKLTQTIAKNNLLMSATFGDSSEVLATCEPNTFSHAFLDYCGTFPTYENEVRRLLVNNSVKVNGLIGLTFACREANVKQQTMIDFHKSIVKEFNCEIEPSVKGGIKCKLLSMVGINYKLVEYTSYSDDSSMVFALLKRVS